MTPARDIYECFDCNERIITVQMSAGMVPLIIPCQADGCDGQMRSTSATQVDLAGKKSTHEFRPVAGQNKQQLFKIGGQ